MDNKFSFKNSIYTDSKGIQQLVDFYNYANNFSNCWFTIDFAQLEWFDANLSADLFLYCHLLKTKNKLKFFIDYQVFNSKFNILKRNGFAYHLVESGHKSNFPQYDINNSTIPLKCFKIDDVDPYVKYIDQILLKHPELQIDDNSITKLRSHYCEIFDNAGIHANSELPIFCCGQYFPKNNELSFSLVDYGDGFLKKIALIAKINKPSEAIDWAVKGNSTKENNIKGGSGIKGIVQYCMKNNGHIRIVSDGCFWSYQNNTINTFSIKNHLKGATIHLTFRF